MLLAALAGLATSAAAPAQVFACSLGRKRIEVLNDAGTLTYRFGRPGKPELVLSGSRTSGNLRHHYTPYPRGEDEYLRFERGGYSYVVYVRWQLARYDGERVIDDSAYEEGGVLVVRGGRILSRLKCLTLDGYFAEKETIDALPREEDDLLQNL